MRILRRTMSPANTKKDFRMAKGGSTRAWYLPNMKNTNSSSKA
ncbi:hypothetical protein T01_5122 [Trichinella spiralis]|uniref:Uncharacterized protein n=1 Tax=Trichinella spiralis TaxID=6334 RepID=A0A0V0Z8C6_TRISP|nr:hypothetical protein T01_5122 [Trichinella spiralis]